MAPCSPVVSDQPAFWHLDAARGPSTPSLDHLVGAGEQRQWHFDAECLGHFKIDDQLDFCGLLDWQISRPLALEDSPRVDADQTVVFWFIAPVTHQAAGRGERAILEDCRHRVADSQSGEFFTVGQEEDVRGDDKRANTHLY